MRFNFSQLLQYRSLIELQTSRPTVVSPLIKVMFSFKSISIYILSYDLH